MADSADGGDVIAHPISTMLQFMDCRGWLQLAIFLPREIQVSS